MGKYKIPEIYFDYPMCSGDELATKQKGINDLMVKISKKPIRANSWEKIEKECGKTKQEMLDSLDENGIFTDLQNTPDDWIESIRRISLFIIQDYHYTKGENINFEIPERILKALVHYGTSEVQRGHRGRMRFHKSVFAAPTCAFNMFLAMLPVMMQVEDDTCTCELWQKVYKVLNDIMLQAWTLPLRGDETDDTPISLSRFRNHVWWVGGNGISYRPVFYTAICFRDVRMIDLMMEIVQKASNSKASQKVNAFWNEGICADGYGWGHGAQSNNNGYPAASINSFFDILEIVKNSPWDYVIRDMAWDNIIHYIRGIGWASYENHVPPMMSRDCFRKADEQDVGRNSTARALEIAGRMMSFSDFICDEYKEELTLLLKNSVLYMPDTENNYVGTRYFFNNDAFVSKNTDRYFYFNMASKRCKGVECAYIMADARNFYICDGSYVILTDEDAYRKTLATWNVAHTPGTTERDLKTEEIKDEINWSGYNSIFDFATGIGYDKYGVSGFIYQKSDVREPDGGGVIYNDYTKEMMGVRAYKSAFVYNDLFVLLGAGITDFIPEYGKDIITTVDNTKLNNAVLIDENMQEISAVKDVKYMQTPVYIKNNGLIYGVPKAQDVTVDMYAQTRRTAWRALNAWNTNAEEEDVPVFEMSINHGEKPVDSTYNYWVSTDVNVTPEQVNSMYTVLSNDKKVQAIKFENKLVSALFYEEGEIVADDYYLEVSAPCAVTVDMLENGKTKVSVADPKQNVELLNITVKFGENKANAKTVTIDMPTKEFIGKQASEIV